MTESLRDALTAAFDTVETAAPAEVVDTPSSAIAETGVSEAHTSKIAEAPAAKPAAAPAAAPSDDRPRNADGTFKEAPKSKDAGAAPPKAQPQSTPSPSVALQPPQAVPAPKARPQRPSSWKKEMWGHWDQIPVDLAEYLNTRESQFAQGVSTYKSEAEAAKPLMEALQPFLPLLQQNKIDPAQWVSNLGHAHRQLAMGSPHEKLQLFGKLAQDYGIPLQALYDQQAQQQFLAQPHRQQPAQQPGMLTREEAQKLFDQKYAEKSSEQEIARFAADAKNKHFNEVRDTMAGLLQANIAADLGSAYEAALALPAFAHLTAADREQERLAQETERVRQEAERVQKAKGKAVSTKSATPTASADGERPKGLRSTLEAAAEQHLSGGRV